MDPFASLHDISQEKQRLLFQELQSVAVDSYAAQGMTRQKGGAYSTFDGSRGEFEMELQCYGRQYCALGDPVIRETDGPHGRTIWYTEKQLSAPLTESSTYVKLPSMSPPLERNTTAKLSEAATGWDKFRYCKSGIENTAEVLLSSLTEPSWRDVVFDAMSHDEAFGDLACFLQKEITHGKTIYPPHEDVFAALNLCPLDKVKVVCVGQDPYHGPSQGHGLAFSVRKCVPPPPSLKNIFKEAMDDVAIEAPAHGNLEHWTQQGVLLLNTVLSVRRAEANSHRGKGWERFTDFIIQHLNDNKEGLVFLLFGNPAHKKANCVDDARHTLIRTSHPSPLGATKTNSPFLGSKCFSRCNQALVEQGMEPVDWTVR